MPLLVLGRIWIRSAGVDLLDNKNRRSSESKSVKSLDLPMGISARAVLIQNRKMAGHAENPISIQPIGYLKNTNAMPPTSSARYTMNKSARNGGASKRCFSWAFLTRGLWGSKETVIW